MTLMPIGIFFSVVLSRGRGGGPRKGGGWLVVGRKWPNLNFKGKEFLKGPHTHARTERERGQDIIQHHTEWHGQWQIYGKSRTLRLEGGTSFLARK